MTIGLATPNADKNGKAELMSLDGGAWVERFLPGKSTPFRSNSFNEGTDASRVTCSISAEGDLAEWAQLADKQIIDVVAANSALYMGKEMSEDALTAAYCPLYRTHEKYAASIKVKVNRAGARATRFWTQEGARTTEPEDWTCTTFAPRLWLKSVWITPGARQWGVSVELTDAQVTEASQECPFATTSEDPFA